jgi:hypothetical protein
VLCCLLGGCLLGGCLLGGAAPLAATRPLRDPAVVVAERARGSAPLYWTRARMAAARLGGGGLGTGGLGTGEATLVSARWAGGGAVARTTGRVFFTLDGTDYSCSGSTVDSANADVVMTAAHCVSDGDGGWATNWIFVPGYRDGQAPYGRYPARTYFTASQWRTGADEDDDVAFVAVNPARVHGVERRVVDAVGGQRISFGDRAATEVLFGYPAEPPYDGRRLDYCDGPLSPDPFGSADEGMPCTMTEGGSGGPWFSGFDPVTGLGTITGVTAFRYAGDALTLYSTDLGSVARSLYEQAEQT